ncbi:LuxR C-terminal-related transcriptional regulator [Solirubrobacter soli]|uniref:LuxR C-terminal-related transcriptional regulator n=1 Tax=Solirubrobacter soli TaxID=363832 RepID=UPI00042009CA|nr:LuxR C-terminal-related transcriptional regulator [Solirubrobacter soli]
MPTDQFAAPRTKLLIPEPRRGQAVRRRVLRALEAGRRRRLTLVSAPTGFGKTSALAAWGLTGTARFAWVSLDEGDDEPTRFWAYVVAAIEGAAPEFAGTAARRLRAPGVSVADEVLPVLADALSPVNAPLVLVLDDYHQITHEAVHAGMTYLLERLDPDVHVVLSCRHDPPLELGRLRARGELNEVRAPQLRFSDEEAAALLNGANGLNLDPEQLASVQARAEGWVAGLNLVAQSPRDAGDRLVSDYLWDEVAARQAPGTREFLMRTSVLERLSGPLCDAVAERADSAAILAELERRNLFLVPLDAEGRWYRYHHMFREMLVRRLQRHAPELVGDLHQRASAWFAGHDDLGGEIDHAVLAGHVHLAADALQRNWLALYSGGLGDRALGWIDRLPAATLAEYPELLLARSAMARAVGRIDEVEPWLRRAEQAADAEPDAPRRAELRAGIARQRAMLALGEARVGEAVRLGRLALDLRPDGSRHAVPDSLFLGVSLFFSAATAEAERRLRAYLDVTAAGEEDVRRVLAMALLAELHAGRGELDEAERLAEQSLEIATTRGLEGHAHVPAAIVLLGRGQVERAEERLERAAALARIGGDRIEIAHALLWLGIARARAGDPGGAEDALEAAREQLAGARVPSLVELIRDLELEIRDTPAAPALDPGDGETLSTAELRVLELLPSDLTYREIADRLYLSLNTVRTHGQRIRRKLGASTRDEAVSAARRLELL